METLQFEKTRDVKDPVRGTPGSAGIDFFVPADTDWVYELAHGDSANIPSGIKARIPKGYALIAMNKSGVALRKSLMVGACVIDSDYEGEIHLHVINCGEDTVGIEPGDKLVQFLLIPVDHSEFEMVDSITRTGKTSERGSGGFGSTGDK